MEHADHVGLIQGGVEGAGRRWLELGAGEGAFTLAVADVLGPGGDIVALDRDRPALSHLVAEMHRRFPATTLTTTVSDFRDELPAGPFDGVLAANSLHFVRDRQPVLAAIRARLRPGGRIVIVEYDADSGNPWVPHPFSFERWRADAEAAGFGDVRLLRRIPSRFLGAMYSAIATSAPIGAT